MTFNRDQIKRIAFNQCNDTENCQERINVGSKDLLQALYYLLLSVTFYWKEKGGIDFLLIYT